MSIDRLYQLKLFRICSKRHTHGLPIDIFCSSKNSYCTSQTVHKISTKISNSSSITKRISLKIKLVLIWRIQLCSLWRIWLFLVKYQSYRWIFRCMLNCFIYKVIIYIYLSWYEGGNNHYFMDLRHLYCSMTIFEILIAQFCLTYVICQWNRGVKTGVRQGKPFSISWRIGWFFQKHLRITNHRFSIRKITWVRWKAN